MSPFEQFHAHEFPTLWEREAWVARLLEVRPGLRDWEAQREWLFKSHDMHERLMRYYASNPDHRPQPEPLFPYPTK